MNPFHSMFMAKPASSVAPVTPEAKLMALVNSLPAAVLAVAKAQMEAEETRLDRQARDFGERT
jgi:hypothetical protein